MMIHHLYKTIRGVGKTYSLLNKLSSINGSDVDESVLDRVMYNVESLPPLGKEYWWFLFFGRDGEKPVQVMILIFRKHGRKMRFNGEEMILKELKKNRFQAVTAGWIYDREILDLGDTNAITETDSKGEIVSWMSGRRMILNGNFPRYRLKVDGLIDLDISTLNGVVERDACGVFIPPFGMGWVDIFLDAEGTILGRSFRGTAHLQKVVGITTFGPFYWGRIVFQRGFSISFFCLKAGKDSKRYFRRSITFQDYQQSKMIKFDNPKLKIRKKEGGRRWIIEGCDDDKYIRIVLANYMEKRYTMKGGGSQVYNEYAVIPEEFDLKTESEVISLSDLGSGVGTFEDAYGSPI